MLTRHRLPIFLTLIFLLVASVSCGSSAEPEPAPTLNRPLRPTFTPTPLAIETQTPVPATAIPEVPPTPVPTDTPAEPPTETPVPPTPTPESGPVAIVAGSGRVNVRSGPGTAYPVVGQISSGSELEIIGRNNANDWWQVCCVNGKDGWIVSRLANVQGNVDGVQVATNIAPPPPTNTPRPVPPTNTPAPAPTPAPSYLFNKYENSTPRDNSNPFLTFYGMVLNRNKSAVVGNVKLLVQGPLNGEKMCTEFQEIGYPGIAGSEFRYNCKVEIPGTTPGQYRSVLVDSGGNQVSDSWDHTVEGEIRMFFPRWIER
ncbi:MAG: SH3 domain-containing protein [Chloroflexota bacterium]|nr:SH3 domain-containing protein [Chloroflexota bacterium]